MSSAAQYKYTAAAAAVEATIAVCFSVVGWYNKVKDTGKIPSQRSSLSLLVVYLLKAQNFSPYTSTKVNWWVYGQTRLSLTLQSGKEIRITFSMHIGVFWRSTNHTQHPAFLINFDLPVKYKNILDQTISILVISYNFQYILSGQMSFQVFPKAQKAMDLSIQ